MSLCNTELKDYVKDLLDSKDVHVKKLVYTSGNNDLHVRHDKAVAIMSFTSLHQKLFQDRMGFRDKYMSVLCDELEPDL